MKSFLAIVSNSKSHFITLLRSGERYAGTDMVYLAKGGLWLTVSQVAIATLALLLSVAFARFVPKDVYGSYRFLLSMFWVITTFSLTGISAALARAVTKDENGAYGESIRLSIIWSWPMILISLGLAVYYLVQGNPLLSSGALIIAVLGPFMQPSFLFGSILEGKRAFRAIAFAGIVLNLVPAIALIATILFVFQNPLAYLSVYLIANAGTAIVISWFVRKRYHMTGHRPVQSLFSLGAHLSIMNILSGIAGHIDRLLVFHYLGPIELAVYSFATALPDQIKSMCNHIATVAFPKFVSRSFQDIQETLSYRLAAFTLLMIAVALGYIAIAPLAFGLFFPAYADAVWYSQIYALALIPLASIFPDIALQAHAAKKELYIFNTASSIFQIGILFTAIAYYGLIGAVVARIVSRAFNLLISVILARAYARRISL